MINNIVYSMMAIKQIKNIGMILRLIRPKTLSQYPLRFAIVLMTRFSSFPEFPILGVCP
jgi:hypothetical protein